MEKITNVGGRLHNPVVGGALTGANEIKDDTKGKMQNVINQETDAELVRLDGAKQEKLTFDQTPMEGSTNPVTSGGVYAADVALQQSIEAILLLIPSAASALNQLADKSFVNSSISTATATFRGTYNLVTDLGLTVSATHQQIAAALASVVNTADNNDYCFVQIPVSDQSTDVRVTERYKFDGTSWEYEYDLNNSGFTADQWGAINSGITSVLVSKLGALPTAAELAVMFNGKQNTLTFDSTPVAGSDNPVKSSGLYNAFAAINALIPSGADANNKLVAESRLVAYVTTLINALDATFDVTSADGHVTLRMTQVDGVITSVQILTSDIASESALTTLAGRVSTAESDIDALQEAYAALTQSDVAIVNGALPSSGQQQNIIYRQPDQDHTPPQFYSDYMWNGTTWVLMATYMNAIDPRPKKGSQNLVTSGGVFDNMSALDVSELNATENPHTLATYADLSAAIAAIPSDYQKGGMSVKFVQSSDNKYVQYMYKITSTAVADFTNPTNWEKMNLEEEVSQLGQSIYNINKASDWHVGYELSSNGGVYISNPDWTSSGDIPVSSSLKYATNYQGNIFCYGENGYIGKVVAGNSLLLGCTFVRLNWLSADNAPFFESPKDISIQGQIDEIEKTITPIDERPQENSTHLVLSGGVFGELSETNEDVGLIQFIQNISNGGIKLKMGTFNASGTEISSITRIICEGVLSPKDLIITVPDGFLVYGVYYYNYWNSNYDFELAAPFLEIDKRTYKFDGSYNYVRFSIRKPDNSSLMVKDVISVIPQEVIQSVYTVNGEDYLGNELQSNGTMYASANWRVSQFVELKDGENYSCNISGNYYYYDESLSFISKVSTTAGTKFNNNTVPGAKFMRTNAPISTKIEIYEWGRYDIKFQNYQFKGLSENVAPDNRSNENVSIRTNINRRLPYISSNVKIKFTTKESLYKQNNEVLLFSIGHTFKVTLVPRSVMPDSYYCDKSEADIRILFYGNAKYIPLRINNYGKDLFSIRIKYPVLSVALDGETTMVTPMPSNLEGAYIKKTDTSFIIYNGDDTIFKSFLLSDYIDVDAFVEDLKTDTDITDYFEIIKYGCEGVSFDNINNFEKVYLSKYIQEILYAQGSGSPTYTGNEYWDSYPTMIKTSDVGYEHVLKFNYKIKDGILDFAYISIDGMFIKFNELNIQAIDLLLTANTNGIIDDITSVSIMPYSRQSTPMLSMQHAVRVSDELLHKNMITTTMRQYDVLAYLKEKGFVGQNYSECIDSLRGSLTTDNPTYCLTFDDYQKDIWENKTIRDIFNQFRAKPTLIYLFGATDLDSETVPSYALPSAEYHAAKASGWDIICHGFCMYTDKLSFSQFEQGFRKMKERWLAWYNEDVTCYNAHGADITDYQFFLLNHMGFNSISSGSANIGWYCEAGTTIKMLFKRVSWMDSELDWDVVQGYIDEWAE